MMDRTTKLLLLVIAVFLGILVLRPMVRVTPEATAQSSSSDDRGTSVRNRLKGWKTAYLSRIPTDPNQKSPDIHVVDSAQSFLVCYRDHIEVWRIADISISRAALGS